MSQDRTKEDIIKFLQLQQTNQNIEPSLEQLLMNLILNPMRMSTTRAKLMDNQNNGLISETKEGIVLNEAGFIEDIKEENIYMFDDGTSLKGIVKCQTCEGIVKEENLKRCGCGKTCCVRPGCGKFSESSGNWYCCNWHAFLGYLGIGLR